MTEASTLFNAQFVTVPLSLIDESDRFRLRVPPYPSLQELADSIRAHGQSTPLFVRPAGSRFELVSGYRRRAALVLVNAATAVVRIYKLEDRAAYELALSENQARDAMTDMERADAALRLQKDGYTGAAIARHLGLQSERWAASYLQLSRDATPPLREALQNRRLSISAALDVLAALKAFDEGAHARLIQFVVERDLSGKRLATFFAEQRAGAQAIGSPEKVPASPYLRSVRGGVHLGSIRIVETTKPEELRAIIAALTNALREAKRFERSQARQAKDAVHSSAAQPDDGAPELEADQRTDPRIVLGAVERIAP
jgi:ParB/RepB/Spo0J family partition protein